MKHSQMQIVGTSGSSLQNVLLAFQWHPEGWQNIFNIPDQKHMVVKHSEAQEDPSVMLEMFL
jgi:hypothetical protein